MDFIDHMDRMLSEPNGAAAPGGDSAAGMTNFQLASTTLDAGVKIYSYRVDSVCTDAYKLMGGLSRTTKTKEGDGIDEGDEGEEGAEKGEGAEAAAAARAAKRAAKKALLAGPAGMAHLEKNPESLNVKKLEMSFDVDPLFHRTSAKFDAGGASGLLLNNLHVSRNCELVFDSADASAAEVAPADEGAPAETKIAYSSLAGLLPAGLGEGLEVSKEFSAFWANVRPGAGEAGDSDDEADDGEEEAEEEEEEEVPVEDEAGVPLGMVVGDHDADLPGFFDDDDDAGMNAEAEAKERALAAQGDAADEEGAAAFMSLDELAAAQQQDGEAAELEVLAPEVAAARGVISERAMQLLQVGQRWAGPGHWKFRGQTSKPAADAADGAAAAPAKKRAPKQSFLIDFSKRCETCAAVEAGAIDKRGTVLSAAALAKTSSADTTLPRDYHCSVDALEALFDKPAHSVRYSKKTVHGRRVPLRSSPAPGSAPADEGAAAAADDFCDDGPAGFDTTDDCAGGWDAEAPVEGVAAAAEEGEGGASGPFSMVAAPEMVAKSTIGYAKVAKQVDIKALKSDVWGLMCDSSSKAKPAKKAPAQPAPAVTSEVSFQEVLGRLPERVPSAKLPDVSFAYCFICLLHLANENGLEIKSTEDMRDLKVCGDP